MQNIYPFYEKVELEEIYGIKRENANPPLNTKTFKFQSVQNIFKYTDPIKYKWFDNNKTSQFEINSFSEISDNYLEIRNQIIKIYEDIKKYLSLKDLRDKMLNYKFNEIYQIYTFLDKLKIINNRDVIEDCITSLKSFNNDDTNDNILINNINNDNINIKEMMIINCICGNKSDYFSKSKEVICKECIDKGKYSLNYSSSDFFKIDREVIKRSWSKREEIKLLEAIEIYGDDWSSVSKFVGTKSKHDCIYHFIMIPILENNLKKIGFSTHVPFMLTSNPVTHLLVFLSSVIHPSVSASVAKIALKEISTTGENIIKNMLIEGKRKGLEIIKLENKKIIRLENVINESLAKLIIMKINSLKSLTLTINKVKDELLEAKEKL